MNGIEWVTVVPAEGELARTARELIDLAGDPALVRTDGNGNEFRVPASIVGEWHKIRRSEVTEPAPAPQPKPVQRRGRAPRVPVKE